MLDNQPASAGFLVCAECGVPARLNGRHKTCNACRRRRRMQVARCRRCNAAFLRADGRQEHCSLACAQRSRQDRRPWSACGYCLGAFRPRKNLRIKYCSKRCSTKAPLLGKSVPVPWSTCACGTRFVARRQRKACAASCLPGAYHPKNAGVPCSTCGTPLRKYQHRYCSDDCRPRYKGRRHHSQVPYTIRYRVAERDGWVCQLCGTPVIRTPRPTNALRSWTVDHIQPSSLGGSHEQTNLRLAHRICNSVRGNAA